MEEKIIIKGIKGKDFKIDPKDKLTIKIAMLFEGHCTIGVRETLIKYGYTEQRYYQLLNEYVKEGSEGIRDKKRGSQKKHKRIKEVINQIIRLRFLDPQASADVISQKLKQFGYKSSKRSVERTITEFGLQKKNLSIKSKKRT